MKIEIEDDQAEITFSLRVPVDLNEKICRQAQTEKRSRQAHIVYLLEKFFETPVGNGKKEAKK